jgi:hypothetical protein
MLDPWRLVPATGRCHGRVEFRGWVVMPVRVLAGCGLSPEFWADEGVEFDK